MLTLEWKPFDFQNWWVTGRLLMFEFHSKSAEQFDYVHNGIWTQICYGSDFWLTLKKVSQSYETRTGLRHQQASEQGRKMHESYTSGGNLWPINFETQNQ